MSEYNSTTHDTLLTWTVFVPAQANLGVMMFRPSVGFSEYYFDTWRNIRQWVSTAAYMQAPISHILVLVYLVCIIDVHMSQFYNSRQSHQEIVLILYYILRTVEVRNAGNSCTPRQVF